MDFSMFEDKESLAPLGWLGTQNWVEFQDYPERRAISVLPRPLKFERDPSQLDQPLSISDTPSLARPLRVSVEEKNRRPQSFWDSVQHIIRSLHFNHVSAIWYLMLSKALAGGPKLFRPTFEQCEALENTEANFAFENYHQPYPIIMLEVPKQYSQKLAESYKLPHGPTYVFVYHDEDSKFIGVSAFFDRKNLITHVTPAREDYKTFEDALIKNRDRRQDASHISGVSDEWRPSDFDAAEVVQRMAVNFAMMMTLFGVHVTGPTDPEEFARNKKLAKIGNAKKAAAARQKLAATVYLMEFSQTVTFYDEVQETPTAEGEGETGTHRSPKTHWRRGHWRTQHHGEGRALTKMIYIKPVLVRASFFVGDVKNTEVTYIIKPSRDK